MATDRERLLREATPSNAGYRSTPAMANESAKLHTDAVHNHSVVPITTEIHLPPGKPETSPTPSSTIPFRRDPDFIAHQALLDQLQEKCAAPAARTALVGLGGVGYVRRA
jgi:hypothetical protein